MSPFDPKRTLACRFCCDDTLDQCPLLGVKRTYKYELQPPQARRLVQLTVKSRLQSRLDSAEQPEPHLVVIACERDHETHPAMA